MGFGENQIRMVNVELGRSYMGLAFKYLGEDLEEIPDYFPTLRKSK